MGSSIFFLPHRGNKTGIRWTFDRTYFIDRIYHYFNYFSSLASYSRFAIVSFSDVSKFHFLMLAMYSGQIGSFSSRDLLLFFIMWELELIHVYLLLSMWGGGGGYKVYFMHCGGVPNFF
ncbi:hypothetical protein Taro_000494 [Colocasia esculenta]|uniref:NADH dehydrogenase subunit 5 n=1 Tax=Colocasia esculenta TaxID=4460 RepID=A0A843TF78_COLES|nr:hypothetical protein [Colocasia esculenta]